MAERAVVMKWHCCRRVWPWLLDDADHAFAFAHNAVATLGLADPDWIALGQGHEPVAACVFAKGSYGGVIESLVRSQEKRSADWAYPSVRVSD